MATNKKRSAIIEEDTHSAREQGEYRRSNRWRIYSSEIASRILAILDDNKEMNQSKLAEILNVTPQQISKIVKGHENMTLETIYKLSKALNFELIIFPPFKWSLMELGEKPKYSEATNIELPPTMPTDNERNMYRGNFNHTSVVTPSMWVAYKSDAVNTIPLTSTKEVCNG